MRRFAADLRRHRRTVKLFLATWVGLSLVTILTWQYRDGYAFGMHPALIPMQFVFPAFAGFLVGTWPRNGLAEGMLAGFLQMAVLLPFGAVLMLLGKVEPGSSSSMLEAVPFLVLSAALGGGVGIVGAALARLVASMRRGASGRRR